MDRVLTAFDRAKDLISRVPVFAYYDPHKDFTLENDACEYELGAALIQEENICKTFPIQY